MNHDDFEQQLAKFRVQGPPEDWRDQVLGPARAAAVPGRTVTRRVSTWWAWANPWTVLAGACAVVVGLHSAPEPDVQPAAVWAARPPTVKSDPLTAWHRYQAELVAWTQRDLGAGDETVVPAAPAPTAVDRPQGRWVPHGEGQGGVVASRAA